MPTETEFDDRPQDTQPVAEDQGHSYTPKEAANTIRDFLDDHQPTVQDRHAEKFVNDVLDVLGWQVTPSNFARVVGALNEHGINPVRIEEYPKHVIVQIPDPDSAEEGATKDYPLVVRNADEEARAKDGNLDADEIARIEAGRPPRKEPRLRTDLYGGATARDPAPPHGPLDDDANRTVAPARPERTAGDGPDFGNAHREPQRSEPAGDRPGYEASPSPSKPTAPAVPRRRT